MTLTDKLSDLYHPLRRVLRPITLGLTLMTSSYCGSGDGERVVYPCRTDADCTSGSCVDGYCENPQDNYSGGSLCEYACETLRDCCAIITGQEKLDCEAKDWDDRYCRENRGSSCMEACVSACEREWSSYTINCIGSLRCSSPQDPSDCF